MIAPIKINGITGPRTSKMPCTLTAGLKNLGNIEKKIDNTIEIVADNFQLIFVNLKNKTTNDAKTNVRI